MKLNRKNKKGFTIVELVIVIGVIGILSAILIPTFANLTTEAQKAARKQQAADAYTAYLVEATDNKFDGLFSRSGAGTEESPYVYSEVKIEQKAQDKVVLKVKSDSWFTYDSKTGWVESTTEPEGSKNLVVANATTYYDAEHNAKADYNQENASTFNGTVVYYIAA